MPQHNAPTTSATTLLRPVSALERLFYRYSERHPAHFLIVAEFGETLTVDRLRPALAAIQRRHPLLSAHVEDRPGARLGFFRAARVAPIELTFHHRPETSWTAVAAESLSRTFDRSRAPMMRAALVQTSAGSALLLTFDHTIADGISSVLVLSDLVAALNGVRLPSLPVPQSGEHAIAKALGHIDPIVLSEGDRRMRRPTVVNPLHDALTNVHMETMTRTETAHLVTRCRAESTTVHAAILAATCRVRAAERGENFVRVLNPINYRKLVGVERACGLYIQATWTGMTPWDGTPFWEQARMMTAHLDVARSAGGIRAASNAIAEAMPIDAEVGDAEELFTRTCPFDMIVTNLGVQNLGDGGPLRPTAVWGPVVQAQIDGEYVTGITTYQGRLRLVTCGRSVPNTFVKSVVAALTAAVEEQ